MAYFPDIMPAPEPTIDDGEFWSRCRQRQLVFQRCADCGHYRHPPGPACPACQSFSYSWEEARDEAELFSFTVVHHPAMTGIETALPYNIAIVVFPSFDHVRLISNVIGVEPEMLRIGMKLRLAWDDIGSGDALPRFLPVP